MYNANIGKLFESDKKNKPPSKTKNKSVITTSRVKNK